MSIRAASFVTPLVTLHRCVWHLANGVQVVSGFQSGATVKLGGNSATATFEDSSTLTATTPAVSPGPQQIVITNPDGESVALDAAFTAN
jgi:IPT/TIG domain